MGRYTSPHLVRVNERITVAGREIGDHAFARAVRAVRDAATRLVARGTLDAHPTFFEVLTAAAFEHFRTRRVDVAVLEVGLGGRLDATNVVEPLASAIVSVDFDHEVYLGRTLAAIAAEKAGVMRRGRPTVVGAVPAAARRALLAAAQGDGRPARRRHAGHARRSRPRAASSCAPPSASIAGCDRSPARTSVRTCSSRSACSRRRAGPGSRSSWTPSPTPSRARAGRAGSSTSPAIPPLVLDGAHNPAGARALAAHLRGGPPFVLVFAAMSDKDVAGLARALFPLATAVVLTQPRVSRAASPGELARRCGTARARGAARAERLPRARPRAPSGASSGRARSSWSPAACTWSGRSRRSSNASAYGRRGWRVAAAVSS